MRLLFPVLIIFLSGACFEKGDCLINNSNLVRISLKKRADNTANTIVFSSIQVQGTAIILYENKEVSAVELPVDPAKNSTTFLLNYANTQQKITFSYTNQTIIPSADCGALIYQKDVTITESSYDAASIRVVNNQLLKNVPVNFEILF